MFLFVRHSIVGVFVLGCFWSVTFSLTDPSIKNPWLDLYLEAESLEWTPPSRFMPQSLQTAPRDITFWKNILPDERDRYADQYLVIPQLGLVTPINKIPEGNSDRHALINGGLIAENKYLKGGIIEYPGSTAPGYRWNRVDFGHSNYYKTDDGRFKTVFANLMRLDPNDEVWYFVRQPDDSYTLFRYLVTASYPTYPNDGQALAWDNDGADAVIFGCYHGVDGRWIVKASYVGDPLWVPTTVPTENLFKDLPLQYKQRIDKAMALIQRMPTKWRSYYLVVVYSWVERIRSTNTALSTSQKAVLDYIEERIAQLYNNT